MWVCRALSLRICVIGSFFLLQCGGRRRLILKSERDNDVPEYLQIRGWPEVNCKLLFTEQWICAGRSRSLGFSCLFLSLAGRRLLIASCTQLLRRIYENWTLLRAVIARITLWEEKQFAGKFASAAAASFLVRLPKNHNVPLIRG